MIQDDTEFKVCVRQCDQCLFTVNRVVSPRRASQVIKDCLKNDNWFECHKFTILGLKVVCRGFWNRHRRDVYPLRIAQMFIEAVKFVEPPKESEEGNEALPRIRNPCRPTLWRRVRAMLSGADYTGGAGSSRGGIGPGRLKWS